MTNDVKGNISNQETQRRNTSSDLWGRSGNIKEGFHEDMMPEP